MNRTSTAAAFTMVALLACCLLGVGCESHSGHASNGHAGETLMLRPESAPGPIGVVRRTDLLVAYHRSAAFDDLMHTLSARRDAAAAAGETETVAAVELYGAMMQEISHRQLAGDEPLYTVLLGVEDELRAIMASRGLSRVVEAGPGAEGVDITDELIAAIASED